MSISRRACIRQLHSRRVLAIMATLALAGTACARGAGEFRLLQPGKDGNLNWQQFHEVAAQAEVEKKAVMIYFFEGEKTSENAQDMISLQMRVFPDEKVKSASSGLICTKVDWTAPETVEAMIARAARKEAAGELLEREREKRKGESEGGVDEAKEGKESKETKPSLIVPTAAWPTKVAVVFVDYRGRTIETLTKISSNSGTLVSAIQKAKSVNEARVKADAKAAEKAAREREKSEPEIDEDESKAEEDEGGGVDR